MKFYITGSFFFSIFNFVILRVLGASVVQILFLTALFGLNYFLKYFHYRTLS